MDPALPHMDRFVARVVPQSLLPGVLATAVLTFVIGVCAFVWTSGGRGREELVFAGLGVLFVAGFLLAAWITLHRSTGAELVIDADGIEVRTRFDSSHLRWSDVDDVRLDKAPGRSGHRLLVASPPTGGPGPRTTKIGYPYLAKSGKLLVIMHTGMLAARREEIENALTLFRTTSNRPQ